ncbi:MULTISPECIES: aldolase/citrate lyase family protein [unclassified Beijerinckia]|uniref:HpcH/HpaI aldolase family protein n=1 Tax=unclassified Beijerinckia TaxID=2638183 RepID=UPI00089BADB6|nr:MULTISPECIES: aldolase/citrate lyase family protein [unclassified Beijerinckia]MDH7797666.1 4-hydroxy-2-oxoheptanedioate aldolase [Beijerinckia sp. GAS462]SEC94277.1 4-hydroxy-2-oxoheptanedioate aldolase [Beijerinckia sp. 28-YEA-48]
MAQQRLNGVIRALESGKPAFTMFSPATADAATALQGTKYDGVVFETEHNVWDGTNVRHALQYLLNRNEIASSGSLAPALTPIVRIPPNGAEMNQTFSKQVLDLGAYGVVWPHVGTAEQAYNAVSACRYPTMKDNPLHEPFGQRGDGPHGAVRYWGLSQQEYYKRADVWPLNPDGEIFVILMIEDLEGIQNLDEILKKVKGIGAVLIGEGDLSQELGYPRQYEHPVVLDHMRKIVETAKANNVVVGHPHVDSKNVERVLSEGYRFLMAAPERTFNALNKGRELAGR